MESFPHPSHRHFDPLLFPPQRCQRFQPCRTAKLGSRILGKRNFLKALILRIFSRLVHLLGKQVLVSIILISPLGAGFSAGLVEFLFWSETLWEFLVCTDTGCSLSRPSYWVWGGFSWFCFLPDPLSCPCPSRLLVSSSHFIPGVLTMTSSHVPQAALQALLGLSFTWK